MNIANSATLIPTQPNNILSTISQVDVMHMMDRYQYSETIRQVVVKENLLPAGVLSRLHASYPQHSGFLETSLSYLMIGIAIQASRAIAG